MHRPSTKFLTLPWRLFFEREDIAACDCFETTDGDQGRIEIRRHKISHDISWLISDRRFPGEPRFPALAMIGMVKAEVERGGKNQHRAPILPVVSRLDRRAVRSRRPRPLER